MLILIVRYLLLHQRKILKLFSEVHMVSLKLFTFVWYCADRISAVSRMNATSSTSVIPLVVSNFIGIVLEFGQLVAWRS
jgi:hypothetical protein